VDGKFMSFRADLANQGVVVDSLGPEHEEGGSPLVLGEQLEERGGADRVWAVVEGERDVGCG
jgi:hypothetical protein